MNWIDAELPVLQAIRGQSASLSCNPAGLANTYTLYYPAEDRLEEISDASDRVRYTRLALDNGVRWHARIDGGAEADIDFCAEGDAATICWRVTAEPENAHIVTLRIEGLLAAGERDANARVALASHGGRIIDPAVTEDGATDHLFNWVLDSFGSCAFAYTQGASASVCVLSMDDMLTSRVGGVRGSRYAQLGVLLRHRYTHLDSSYRRAHCMRGALTGTEKSYPIETEFAVPHGAVRLEWTDCEALGAKSGWVPAARRIHRQLPPKRTGLYGGYMVYKIFAGSPADGVVTTAKQLEEMIRSVWERTGGVKQMVYIVGFQHKGHDSLYPDVFTPNAGFASAEELARLAKTCAEKYGALISFHDNYDDAYRESPAFDEDVIARDNLGHLLRGGVWNGSQAYWISLPQYAGARAQERIDKTLNCYPFLRESYHLDVLTASVFRLDFRKGDPSGRQRDLEARLRVIDQFAQKKLDVSSESCGLPFLGAISYFWHMQHVPRPVYAGDERAPVVTFLAHGKADYSGAHTDHPSEILDALLYGNLFGNDVRGDTPIKRLTDAAFMLFMPLDRIRDRHAVRYEERGGWKQVTYDKGAVIAVNFEEIACRVDVDGRRLVENGTAMIPQKDGSTLLYVAWEEPYAPVCMRCALAEGSVVSAEPVSADGETQTLTVGPDGLRVDLPVGVAYRIKV